MNSLSGTMITPVQWARPWIDRSMGEPDILSPFQQPRLSPIKRPLTLTLDSERLLGLSEGEATALQVLEQTSVLPEVDMLSTSPEAASQVVVSAYDRERDYFPVTVFADGRVSVYSGIDWASPEQLRERASMLASSEQRSADVPEVDVAVDHLLVALAHRALQRDILVTTSPCVLQSRSDALLRASNPMLPSQAAKVVGLFLRSRDVYLLPRTRKHRVQSSRAIYYWTMARHRLPAFWRYTSACVSAAKLREDNSAGLALSIISRCARVLEARDAIGEFFYKPKSTDDADRMMYHFEYLHLLLTGAFDAAARITHRVYRLGSKSDERRASFHGWLTQGMKNKAVQRLSSVDPGLVEILSEHETLLKLLHGVRNTVVHAESAGPVSGALIDDERFAVVGLPDEAASAFRNALDGLVVRKHWGFVEVPRITGVEPYTYANRLVTEGFEFLNEIASSTRVELLFADHPVPELAAGPTTLTHGIDYYSGPVAQQIRVLG